MESVNSKRLFSFTRICCALAVLAIGTLFGSAAYGDVIDFTVNGAVQGTGGVGIRDGGEDQFDFSGTNTQLGTFSRSGHASVTQSLPGGRSVVADALIRQTTAVTSSSLSIDLLSQFLVDRPFGGEWGARADLSNSYGLGFTLTTESLMLVTNQLTGTLSSDLPYLTGTGIGSQIYIPLDQTTFMLGPGQYGIGFYSRNSIQLGPEGGGEDIPPTNDFLQLSLTADFTPIPEPAWTPVVTGLLAIVSGYAHFRRRSRKDR